MSGNEARYEALYRQNQRDLFYYIVRSVKEEQVALDLLQDIFVNFIRIFNGRELPPDLDCRKYLFRIARNLIINLSKSAYTRRVSLAPDFGENVRDPGQGSVEDQVVSKVLQEKAEKVLRELLGELKEEERTALILRYQSDLKLEEISQVLDISVSRTSRLIQSAARKLVQAGRKRGIEVGNISA